MRDKHDETETRQALCWVWGTVIWFGALVLWLAAVKPAAPHTAPSGWQYPAECCSDRDCAPLSENEKPRPLANGAWLLVTGEVVLREQVRWSPDGLYHLCRFPGGGQIFCLFVPPQGS